MVKIPAISIPSLFPKGIAVKPRADVEPGQALMKPLATSPPPALEISPLGRLLRLTDERAAEPFSDAAGSDAASIRKQEVIDVGRQFEAVFLRYLVTAMRGTGSEGMSGSEYYEGLIDENMSRILAESENGIQLGEMLARGMDGAKTESDA